MITCKGIGEFPRFNQTDIWNIDMLDIINTTLKTLPNLEDWRDLSMLTVIENPFLACEELKNGRHSFYINSDCPKMSVPLTEIKDPTISDPIIEITESIQWPYYLSFIPVILLFLAGGYKSVLEYLKRTNRERDIENRVNGVELYQREFLKEGQSS